VKHVLVSAAEAPPVRTTAPNSVFALGATAEAATPPPSNEPEKADMPNAAKTAAERKDHIVKTLEACGALSSSKIAEAVGIDPSLVAIYCKRLIADGRVVKHGNGRATTYSAGKASGFKGWLKR
jgi:Winged helix-turn-helix DNA-binding